MNFVVHRHIFHGSYIHINIGISVKKLNIAIHVLELIQSMHSLLILARHITQLNYNMKYFLAFPNSNTKLALYF